MSTAEKLKLELASAIEPADPSRKEEVRGRHVQTGAPGAIEITAAEVHQVTQHIVRKIAEEVSMTLTDLSPEVSGDIYDRGVILTGGGALLDGLGPYLQKETRPGYSSCRGTAIRSCPRSFTNVR